MDRLQELVRLHRMRTGKRKVARLLMISPNTERQYRRAIDAAGLLFGPVGELPELEVLKAAVATALEPKTPPQQLSSLEKWRTSIEALWNKGLGPRAIYDRLRLEDPEFGGTVSAMKRFCRGLRKQRGVQPEDVVIPVETAPGQIAQVDFGYVGMLYDPEHGCLRRAWVFVVVLGYSRQMVARLCFDQKVETWLRLHAEAFAELGGVVETVVPDNLKSAVIRAAFGVDGSTSLNRSYREFARFYGFKIDPTPVRDPKKKGKVESGVKYVKGNALRGLERSEVGEVQRHLNRWILEIAGTREHGTTGRRPIEDFLNVEQPALQRLPVQAYQPVVWKPATVHRDCHVAYEKRLYSVPWRLIGKAVWLRITPSSVMVYADDVRVATHARRGPGHRSTVEEHLPEQRAPWRHRSRAYWEERAHRIGAEVEAYVREVFDSDPVLSMLRTVQAVVTLLEGFPKERAEAACRRARFYGNYTYGGVKRILREALDLQPLPTLAPTSTETVLARPRFARSLSELLDWPMEKTDEPN